MLLVRKDFIDNINSKLTYLSMMITNSSSLNLLELNVHAENFYASLFNHIFNIHLENINTTKHNVASIDLIDNENKLFVQVTSNARKSKIEDTLEKASEIYDKELSYLENEKELVHPMLKSQFLNLLKNSLENLR